MEFVQQLSLYMFVSSLVLLLIGLFKPWVTLWWEDIQNRKKVITLYGSIAFASFLMYEVLNLISLR
jgi:hypothetical protein